MGKMDLDYLAEKYKVDERLRGMLKQKKYRDIMTTVFDVNIQELNEKVGVRSREKWRGMIDKPSIPPAKYKLPKVQDIIPTRQAVYNRAFQRASSVSNRIRGDLGKKLRKTVAEFEGKHRVKAFLKGKINPKLEEQMTKQMTRFFSSYTKKHPRAKRPANVQALAVTELRSSINNAKASVARKVKEMNPELQVKKTWRHNAHLSLSRKNIRVGHQEKDGETLLLEDRFTVPIYREVGGIQVPVGSTEMLHPHDPSAPAVQIVSCHCDIEYSI